MALLLAFVGRSQAQFSSGPNGETFSVRVVIDKLSDPWEVTWGPDGYLWVTEAKGYRVSRINPADGKKTLMLDLTKARNFPRYDVIPDEQDGGKPWPQGGLMGLALHPQLLSGKPYVYLAYLYKTRVVRYTYDSSTQVLTQAVSLCDTIPGSSDHNSGRLLVAPVNGKPYVFYTVGDMGAGQFDNVGRPNHAQQISVYEGKVLRFNTEPDADANPADQWIPNDNPFNTTRQNAVWSYGHRNAQGLAYGVVGGTGRLYVSEHGPMGDDEVNLIEKGKNYGHPLVIGYDDNNYNGLAAGVSAYDSLPGIWNTTYPTIGSETDNARAIGAATYRGPLKSLHPLSSTVLTDIFIKIRTNEPKKPDWPAEAPSSLAVYTASAIPGWQNSLLIPTLKTGKLIRLPLSQDGRAVVGDTLTYIKGRVRYRDIALSPDGRKLYLAVDSSAVTSGPSGEGGPEAGYRGCILEFTYQPPKKGATQETGTGQADRPRRRRR
ncbi:hypothetical protein DYU11_19305 [Fibrisoma montanum]|uniref:Glucose/Sorbosone dehydrogenase domain-containing protein n=1 Tax=Fibrisoma montanum TaxID=2305895 RepID=A0A418M6K6_9BACT|nr:PQQ-dependent sugar dehydrogenase [Fibrisoma montanum]RIV21550.1 hypothetical protein DYU11_19305 [Fibrisoma montanum]